LINLPLNYLSDEADDFVANQQGRAQGLRLVYSRRLNEYFQHLRRLRLSATARNFPNRRFQIRRILLKTIFSSTVFRAGQRRFGKRHEQVKTIFRLSPQATVFAIDPFQGRMTIYDPGLSVLVTQSLPNLGLPIRAEAVARRAQSVRLPDRHQRAKKEVSN
jgi:hypothetical protein